MSWIPLVVIVIIAVLMADVIGRISKTTSKDNSSKTTTKAATYEAIADTMEFDISDDAIAFIMIIHSSFQEILLILEP